MATYSDAMKTLLGQGGEEGWVGLGWVSRDRIAWNPLIDLILVQVLMAAMS